MASLADLGAAQARERLAGPGLDLAIPPYTLRIRSPFSWFARDLSLLYADYRLLDDSDPYLDLEIDLAPARWPARLMSRQAWFSIAGTRPFNPLAREQAFPMFEWGLNWCVTNYLHTRLSIHAAAVARGRATVILPGAPGSGKSTLCAAALAHGFDLISDELALLAPDASDVIRIPRPISLKNASIDVIRAHQPKAVMNEPVADTLKGTVAHVRPPQASLDPDLPPAEPRLVVFPRFRTGASTEIVRISRGDALMRLVDQSFNFQIHGIAGFDALTRLMQKVDTFELHYSDVDGALSVIDDALTRGPSDDSTSQNA